MRGEGHEELWRLFGLSYASWLVLPRVLMHEMPDDWQGKMAALLDEYFAAFPDAPELDYVVTAKRGGKFVSLPESLCNYRYPDKQAIAGFRGADAEPS